MSDPEIKWRHFIEPVPKFLKQQPNQGGDSNIAFFKYVEENQKDASESTQKKYKIIMSKTSIILLVGLLLLLSLLFFMAGFLVSKDIHEHSKTISHMETLHNSQPFQYVPPKESSKIEGDIKAAEHMGEKIVSEQGKSLEHDVSGFVTNNQKIVQDVTKKNPMLSKMENYYHKLTGIDKTGTNHAANSMIDKQHGVSHKQESQEHGVQHTHSAQKPVHQAHQARLWPVTPGSDEMFQVKPLSQNDLAPHNNAPNRVYNYDVDNYIPNQIGSKSDNHELDPWVGGGNEYEHNKSSEYTSQFSDNSDNVIAPIFTNDQVNETLHVNKYTVQVGAFQKIENARQLAHTLVGNNIDAKVYQGWDEGKRPWYFVRIGHHKTIDAANQEALHIMDQGKMYGNDNPTPYAIVVKGTAAEKLVQ